MTGVGRVVEARPGRLGIDHAPTTKGMQPGSSIAVNGVCLTVIATEGDAFFADLVPETLQRTNLGHLKPGDEVNLEPPLKIDEGLDGHLVQGHVDGVAEVLQERDVELGRELTVELPRVLERYVAEKGSIAVDGTSLTVAAVGDGFFAVALIPHTLERTIAHTYRRGTRVNLEVDVIARYAERLLGVK